MKQQSKKNAYLSTLLSLSLAFTFCLLVTSCGSGGDSSDSSHDSDAALARDGQTALTTVSAPLNLQSNDLNGFMNQFCLNFNFPQIDQLLGSINNILSNAQNFVNALQGLLDPSVNVNVPNPLNCLPNLNVGVAIGGLDPNAMLACFNKFPDFSQLMSQIAQCMANQLPNINVDLPSFDPNAINQCLQNSIPSVNVGITNPLQALGGLIGAINDLIAMINNLQVALSDIKLNMDFLKNYCQIFRAGGTAVIGLSRTSEEVARTSESEAPKIKIEGDAEDMEIYLENSAVPIGRMSCQYDESADEVLCQ